MLLDDPIIHNHDSADGRKDDGVASHKGEEANSVSKDLPRTDGPASNYSTKDLAAADIDVLREIERETGGQRSQIERLGESKKGRERDMNE